MKLALIIILTLAVATMADWDCDNRCPGYQACLQENANSRRKLELDPSMIEDIHGNATWPIHHVTNNPTVLSSSTTATNKNLRGSDMALSHRKLEELLVFNLKLFWEEGACWQTEWREREWCLKCEGSTCQTDDYLVLDECSSSSRQRFIYRPVPGSGGGKISPFTERDLCWTRTRVNAHQLRPCGDGVYTDRDGRDIQIIVGFQNDVSFELHPNGIEDKCMST